MLIHHEIVEAGYWVCSFFPHAGVLQLLSAVWLFVDPESLSGSNNNASRKKPQIAKKLWLLLEKTS